MNTYYDEYLTHHGVKGMKWGVRKERTTSSDNTKKKTYGKIAVKRLAKTAGQTAIAFAAPVAIGTIFVASLLLGPTATLPAYQLATQIKAGAELASVAGAGTAVIANGAKFVKEMLSAKRDK